MLCHTQAWQKQQSFCDTCQAWMNCWFSPSTPCQKWVQTHLPNSGEVKARGSTSTAFFGVCRCLVLWHFVSVRKMLQHFLLKWMDSQHTWAGRFCTEWCISLTPAMTNGHSAKLSIQSVCAPMGRTNLRKTWAHTFLFLTTQCAENFQNPREKVEGFRFYFVFQCQLWNTQNVLVEQKFPCNLMVACQEFSVWLFLNRRWTLGSSLKGNVPEPLELVLFLLTMAKASPQKPELLVFAPPERKQLLWQSLLADQTVHFSSSSLIYYLLPI